MKTNININSDIISWAIVRAGYELDEFIHTSPVIESWINKTKKPTKRQLEKFSVKVHIPFGYLFLNEPPKEKLPIPFFRSGNNSSSDVSINVYDTILIIQKRQEWLKDYLNDIDSEKLPFVGKYNSNNNPTDIVDDIRKTLNLKEDWASLNKNLESTTEKLIQRIEEVGIVINFNGIVGNSTHRPIKVDECRGFVLVDSTIPFMFINASDGKAAQLFTIVHELAHIWIGESAGFDFRKLQPANQPIEILCDKIAAEFLVPEKTFIKKWNEHPQIKTLAGFFKVSEIVIARRALDLKKITKPQFYEFYNSYTKELKLRKETQGSRGNFYATQKKRLSLRFAAYINSALKENKLLYRDAYKLTGLKGDTYQNFINKYF